jgi:hypothetical protein
MFEDFIIGFLLGTISMLPIFPIDDEGKIKASFWRWLYAKITKR